jgi:hypothetical protein
MLDEGIEAFLRKQTAGIKHSGRTFFEHLAGTHDLLQRHGAPDRVCLAGAFHSIYGTNIFHYQAMPFTERDQVAGLIGEEAERLAYIFCSCKRPLALVTAAMCGPPYHVMNYRDGKMIPLSATDMIDLLEIEAANLEDQGGGKMLSDVWTALRAAAGGRRAVSAADR